MLRFKFVLFFVSGCMAQVPFPEVCPTLETVPNFDVPRYMGLWYEFEKYFAHFEIGGKCVTAKYTLNTNGTVLVKNSQISSTTGLPASITGIGTPIGRSDVAKLSVSFRFGNTGRESPYWVIGTDYDNWAVVWSCRNDGLSSRHHSWILTRQQIPPATVIEQAYQVVDRNNITRTHFVKTDQTNCPA